MYIFSNTHSYQDVQLFQYPKMLSGPHSQSWPPRQQLFLLLPQSLFRPEPRMNGIIPKFLCLASFLLHITFLRFMHILVYIFHLFFFIA